VSEVLVVLLQAPDLCASSETTTSVIGSRSTQPITLEMMRISMIEHVFIMIRRASEFERLRSIASL
jgi:hypothetical protein